MKYYQLRQSSDPKVIGVNNGVYQAEMVESKWDKNELDRYVNDYLFGIWDTVDRIKNGETVKPPKLDYLELLPKAILTDVLTFAEPYAGGGFLISDRLRRLLRKYNFIGKIYTDVKLHKSGKPVAGYANLHLIPLEGRQAINFEKSVCYQGSLLTVQSYIYPKSYEEYLKICREGKYLLFESVHLNKSAVEDLDIFSLDTAVNTVYISERLKEHLFAEGITGINIFKPISPKLIISEDSDYS